MPHSLKVGGCDENGNGCHDGHGGSQGDTHDESQEYEHNMEREKSKNVPAGVSVDVADKNVDGSHVDNEDDGHDALNMERIKCASRSVCECQKDSHND